MRITVNLNKFKIVLVQACPIKRNSGIMSASTDDAHPLTRDPCAHILHALQAQQAFVSASIQNFEITVVDQSTNKLVTGRLGSVRLRDKSKEARRCREVVTTCGDKVCRVATAEPCCLSSRTCTFVSAWISRRTDTDQMRTPNFNRRTASGL